MKSASGGTPEPAATAELHTGPTDADPTVAGGSSRLTNKRMCD